eukprot:TRINITY_DN4909_c2_g1_i2.p1 TRINITY_DN4909_c2_g1~~TRINITY_DN4909_c2_g1_i2.p1  ORF type:complete len:295 (+),score=32.07 TRINITY_DN4909_c2_g1_i2:81-965(+)
MSGIGTKKPWQGLVCGAGGSLVSDTVCTPLDVLKVRMQLSRSGVLGEQYSGLADCAVKIAKSEGASGFFKGLKPALLRSGTYGTCRLGLYEPIKQAIAGDIPKADLKLHHKMAAGMTSGCISSFIFTPCDVIKIRMQADTTGKKYPGLISAFKQILKQESLSGLYKGASPNVGRAGICACVELSAYDEVKSRLLASSFWGYGDTLPTHIGASLIAGFLSTVASQPVDLVKSRLMQQGTDSRYSSPLSCLRITYRNEGLRGMYAGFWPSYMRIAPHTLVIFVVIEQIRHLTGWAS